MNAPSPTSMVIASLIESALAPIFATMSAPLLARIEQLETKQENSVGATKEFFKNEAFGNAVMDVIESKSSDVVEALGDDLTEAIESARTESIENAVENAISNGSFSVEFSKY